MLNFVPMLLWFSQTGKRNSQVQHLEKKRKTVTMFFFSLLKIFQLSLQYLKRDKPHTLPRAKTESIIVATKESSEDVVCVKIWREASRGISLLALKSHTISPKMIWRKLNITSSTKTAIIIQVMSVVIAGLLLRVREYSKGLAHLLELLFFLLLHFRSCRAVAICPMMSQHKGN